MHGLRGHPRYTWGGDSNLEHQSETETVPSSTSSNSRGLLRRLRRGHKTVESKKTEAGASLGGPFWPEELLADDIPVARVWTYGYNADVIEAIFRASNKNSISSHGRDLAVRFDRDMDNAVCCVRYRAIQPS